MLEDAAGIRRVVIACGYVDPVSYTHLDVYKRQSPNFTYMQDLSTSMKLRSLKY